MCMVCGGSCILNAPPLPPLHTTVPQHVVMKIAEVLPLRKVGIYLHGENNQNPKRLSPFSCPDNVLAVILCQDATYCFMFRPAIFVQLPLPFGTIPQFVNCLPHRPTLSWLLRGCFVSQI